MKTSNILKTLAVVVVFLIAFVLVDILTHIVIVLSLSTVISGITGIVPLVHGWKLYLVEYLPDLCGAVLGVYGATIFTKKMFKDTPAKAIFWSFIGFYSILLATNYLMSEISSPLQEVLIRPAIWTIEVAIAAWYFLLRAKPIISPFGPDPLWAVSWLQSQLIGTYTVLSFILSIATILQVGVVPAFCLFGISMISLTATSIFKYSVVRGSKQQKIVFPIIAIVLLAFVYWISSGISVHVFAFYVSGLTWGIIGAVIGISIPASWGDKWPSEIKRKPEFQREHMTVADASAAYQRQDYQSALKILLPLAEQGNADAQTNLGFMYNHGQGFAQDYVEAAKWYRKAAEQGYATAQNNLGHKYEMGEGIAQDYSQAIEWYRKAAEQGNAAAQNNLGHLIVTGQGVALDNSEAMKWFQKAAEQRDGQAQHNLGVMYFNGTGVVQDYSEAMKWFQKAADQGNVNAEVSLGNIYANGLGVAQDYVLAHIWFSVAADHGDTEAAKLREDLEKYMTPSQITAALGHLE